MVMRHYPDFVTMSNVHMYSQSPLHCATDLSFDPVASSSDFCRDSCRDLRQSSSIAVAWKSPDQWKVVAFPESKLECSNTINTVLTVLLTLISKYKSPRQTQTWFWMLFIYFMLPQRLPCNHRISYWQCTLQGNCCSCQRSKPDSLAPENRVWEREGGTDRRGHRLLLITGVFK